MKTIRHLNSIADARFIGDLVSPPDGFQLPILVATIKLLGKFGDEEALMVMGSRRPPLCNFKNGTMDVNGVKTPITQITFFNDGVIVIAPTTEQADAVIAELSRRLDEAMNSHFVEHTKKAWHTSSLIVQFERSFDDCISKLSLMAEIINSAPKSTTKQYVTKRLAFGYEIPQGLDPFDPETASDFVIERRVAMPFEGNFYFSSAPMTTTQHVKTLEKIEASLSPA